MLWIGLIGWKVLRMKKFEKDQLPRWKKLKKQIAELWEEKLVVEKGKSAFGKFARQFIIRGDDSLSPQEFFREKQEGK